MQCFYLLYCKCKAMVFKSRRKRLQGQFFILQILFALLNFFGSETGFGIWEEITLLDHPQSIPIKIFSKNETVLLCETYKHFLKRFRFFQCQECLLSIYIINLKIFGYVKYKKKIQNVFDSLHFKKVSVVSVAAAALLHPFMHHVLTRQLQFFQIQKSRPEGVIIKYTTKQI